MKIAYIIPSLVNTGPQVVVYNLVKNLVSQFEIDVYYFDDIFSLEFDCPTHKIKMNKPIDFDYYDIIHSHCLRPDLYVFLWRNKIKRAKIITTLHQDTYQTFSYQYSSFTSYIATFIWTKIQSVFDGVVCISNQLKNSYNRKIRSELYTIYNGCSLNYTDIIDLSIITSITNIKERYIILGSFALVTRRKGLDQVIKALTYLENYALVIIGDGPEIIHLKDLSTKLGVDNRVLFFSYQKYPHNYISMFDIYVMPSYSEGFGLAMIEAALARKSIVCSDIPSFNEIFNYNQAEFFQLNNIESLVSAIENAYKKKDELGNAAYERAISSFTSEVMSKNYADYYNALLLRK